MSYRSYRDPLLFRLLLVLVILAAAVSRATSQTVAAPSSVAATAPSPTQVNLTWSESSTNVTSFTIYRAVGSGSFAQLTNVSASYRSYSDTTVSGSTAYSYYLIATAKVKKSIVSSSASNIATVTTPAVVSSPSPTPTPSLNPVQLPIEVMGAAGTVVASQVSVSSTDAPNVTGIWMQVHGLGYANKASVQINNGAWIDLNNSTAKVAAPGSNFGGIGGSFATLQMTVPLPAGAVVGGTNTVSLRFNGTDGISSGYRVLAFNLVTSTGANTVSASSFVQDDPSTWQPPLTDSASISAGYQLWTGAPLIASTVNPVSIQAHCSDCHARDGRDLKYFNYSNFSIIARSKFHGLTDLQGQQIASYIRSLNQPNPGRPWNPPYQPGPGTDALPISSWAAGAGLGYVLDRDGDTLPYLFPAGISKATIATTQTTNVREIPIALQLPDWNHWLPTIHPLDAWGSDFWGSNLLKRYDGSGTGTSTWNLRQLLGKGITSSTNLKSLFGQWSLDRHDFLLNKTETSINPSIVWTPDYARAVYSTGQWQIVKNWELMEEFNVEGYGPLMYGSFGESRTWYANIPFEISPARLKIPENGTGFPTTPLPYEYLSNAWYYVQLVLNAGDRNGDGQNPVDWGYSYGRLINLYSYSGFPEGMRMTVFLVKAMQENDNGKGPALATSGGWSPNRNDDIQILVNPHWTPLWASISASNKTQIMQALLGTWYDKTLQYTPTDYYNAGMASATQLPGTNPTGGPWIDKVWYMIPQFRSYGVDGTMLNGMCDWAATIWPLANWASLKQ